MSDTSRSATIRSRWAAIGAAVAVSLGAGGIGITHATTDAGDGPVSAFFPIEPCRLAAGASIGPDSSITLDGRGTSGDCELPDDITGLAANVTAVNATRQTNIRLYAQGDPVPDTANLNPAPGAPPTPNAVNITLNTTNGLFNVYNRFGTVAVFIDVMGYYDDHTHDDRYYTEAESDARFGFEWASIRSDGTVFRASPGLTELVVTRPTPTAGYYCIELPDDHDLEPHGAVASIEDHTTGLQARTISVNSFITDGVCDGTGEPWDIYVQTARSDATGPLANDAYFRLLIPPASPDNASE